MVQPKPFNIDDLDRSLTDQNKLIMAETIFAWADLDTGISRLVLLMFGVAEDAGSIPVGNMDLKTKIEKIRNLYGHYGNVGGSNRFNKLSAYAVKYSQCRNTIAHRKCVGRLLSEPNRIVFLSAKHVPGALGQFEMLSIDHSEFVASARFARDAAVKIGQMIAAIEQGRADNTNSY